MSLELIENLVNEEVGRRQNEVFGLLFAKAKKEHISQRRGLRDGCHCDYCKVLREYITAKIHLTRFYRNDLIDMDCMAHRESLIVYQDYVHDLRMRKNEAKQYRYERGVLLVS